MKIRITFKDPDALHECVRNAIDATLPEGLSDDEREVLIDSRQNGVSEKLRRHTLGQLHVDLAENEHRSRFEQGLLNR